MRIVNESELAERRAMLKSLGPDLDPEFAERLARLDEKVAKFERSVELM